MLNGGVKDSFLKSRGRSFGGEEGNSLRKREKIGRREECSKTKKGVS